ncbi:Zinc finger, SWIM-type [Cynara cardunculus var. scolymus]|uniref:Zinc finger, SWIM-type n=1 Tax=Cynara cardunculus var. scolymus TaxID=59895 RepID=A0A118JSF5_CYNCS|nr:Zinc finger, SWIM-type [Cynara cardunculus var. scolymus]
MDVEKQVMINQAISMFDLIIGHELLCVSELESVDILPSTGIPIKGCGIGKHLVGMSKRASINAKKPKILCKTCEKMGWHDSRSCSSKGDGDDSTVLVGLIPKSNCGGLSSLPRWPTHMPLDAPTTAEATLSGIASRLDSCFVKDLKISLSSPISTSLSTFLVSSNNSADPNPPLAISQASRFLNISKLHPLVAGLMWSTTSSGHIVDSTYKTASPPPPSAPIANWKISTPDDHPEDVKARLKYWAQAVACIVRS